MLGGRMRSIASEPAQYDCEVSSAEFIGTAQDRQEHMGMRNAYYKAAFCLESCGACYRRRVWY